jgi:hypothetical protein
VVAVVDIFRQEQAARLPVAVAQVQTEHQELHQRRRQQEQQTRAVVVVVVVRLEIVVSPGLLALAVLE